MNNKPSYFYAFMHFAKNIFGLQTFGVYSLYTNNFHYKRVIAIQKKFVNAFSHQLKLLGIA